MKRFVDMIFATIVILIILCGTQSPGVQALNAELRRLSDKWDPEDPFNSAWQDELYEYSRTLDDDATFFTKDEDDRGRLPEMDCIEMDDKMY